MYRKLQYAQNMEKTEQYLMDWSKALEDDESEWEGNEVAEEGEDEVTEGGEGVAVEEDVAEVGEEGVIWDGDDIFTCRGYNPFYADFGSKSSNVIDNLTVLYDFPKFINGDEIDFYEGVFSLVFWYKNHK